MWNGEWNDPNNEGMSKMSKVACNVKQKEGSYLMDIMGSSKESSVLSGFKLPSWDLFFLKLGQILTIISKWRFILIVLDCIPKIEAIRSIFWFNFKFFVNVLNVALQQPMKFE